ncbi:MAG TPA: hypothetical protein VFN14_06630 [Candidatus Limnocylindria bacterium]|nr:hypothetical protein [Candidatus Limnocylindria bacterium]
MPRREEEAGSVIGRTVLDAMAPDAAQQLALAQVRIAWQETVAAAGLERGGLTSRVVRVDGETARIEASEPILAQELTLRGEALVWAVNERMRGRPGATIVLVDLAVSVGRWGGDPRL